MTNEMPTAPGRQGMHRLRRIYGQLSRRRRLQFLLLALLSLVGVIAELLTIGAVLPLLFIALQPDQLARFPLVNNIIQSVTGSLGVVPLAAAAILLAIAAVGATVIRLLIQWYTQRLVFAVNHDLATQLYGKILRQPFEWHAHHHSSIILSAMEKVYQISVGVILSFVSAVSSLIISLFVVGLLFAINPTAAALAALLVGLIYALLILLTKTRNAAASSRMAALRDQRVHILQESSGGIRDIALDQTQPYFEQRFSELDRQFNKTLVWNQMVMVLPRIMIEGALIILIAMLAVWFSARPGGLTLAIPALGAMAIGAQRLLPLVQQVYTGYGNYALSIGQIDDVLDLLELPVDEPGAAAATIDDVPFEREIRFADVTFDYHSSERALHHIDLSIKAGERVGIIGRTGSGKSTLVDLMMGLLRPTSGEIRIDGKPLTDRSLPGWKSHIAHVPQHIFLADNSIATNVAFGQEAVDRERVEQCLAQAGLADWIATLPNGMDSFVGERGVRLSGGQRQRVGIARALYKDARLLVLDEATSSLDNETEQVVMDAVNGLDRKLTVVIIAHRLSTVEACDTIVRLDAGRIATIGSFTHVVADGN